MKRLPEWIQQSMLSVLRADTKNAASSNAEFVVCFDKNSGAKIGEVFGNAKKSGKKFVVLKNDVYLQRRFYGFENSGMIAMSDRFLFI